MSEQISADQAKWIRHHHACGHGKSTWTDYSRFTQDVDSYAATKVHEVAAVRLSTKVIGKTLQTQDKHTQDYNVDYNTTQQKHN